MHRDYQPSTVADLIQKLEDATKEPRRGKAIKKTFKIINSEREIISWKFNEWEYGKDKVKLPSDARGLFTLKDENRIVIRGYDKFFNIDEVYFTKWNWLEENTIGPYYVTSKENGCIILISGLEDGTLVVCSKHSTGSREDVDRNHAVAGQEFLEGQLKKIGISAKEFALKLFELNVTAVAEYCDDHFEEHIVEYRGDNAGLYLHGLNLNLPIFQTFPIDEVQTFARTYGFKSIDYFSKVDINELKQILEECSKTGSYNGKETEGFVIRCQLKQNNQDYFFKFKFEEPYLMYRQWREVTRAYIQSRNRDEIRISKHKYITNNYLDFVIPLIEDNEEVAKNFLSGFGIIDLRQKFLKHYGKTGSEILNQELLEHLDQLNLSEAKVDQNTKFVFVPVATIGCGKTTTGLTLTNLNEKNWGIVINDDIPRGKGSTATLVKRSLGVLKEKSCVVVDKNNHQLRERKELLDLFKDLNTNHFIQYICLNFSNVLLNDELWNITTDRVMKRGDNHQSIKALTDGEKVVKGIMSGFIKRFQPVNPTKSPDSEFDLIIDLDVNGSDSSLENSKKIMRALGEKYPEVFNVEYSAEEFESSFNKALSFTPTFTKEFPKKKNEKAQTKDTKKRKPIEGPKEKPKQRKRKPVYFSIDLKEPKNTLNLIHELLIEKGQEDGCLLTELALNKRIQDEFHVTLAHVSSGTKGTEEERTIWTEYLDYLHEHDTSDGKLDVMASVKLKSLIWNDKALAVLVEVIGFSHPSTKNAINFKVSNKYPHITIGTATPETKPYYSNELAGIADSHMFEEGKYEDVTIINWKSEVIVENLPVIVNY